MAEPNYTSDDIWNLIDGETVCMFSNLDDSVIRSRPMAPMARRDDGVIWFVTDRTSGKMQDLGDDTPVTLTLPASTFTSRMRCGQIKSRSSASRRSRTATCRRPSN